jgi:F0F1-type ATP synthase assembly protein I
MPQDGDSKPVPPSPGEYEKLRREADSLRESEGVDQAKQQARLSGQQDMGKYLRYTGIGLQFLVMMGLPMALGWWLDGVIGTRPWLMVGGAVLGIVAAMVFVVRTVARMEGPQKAARK